MLVVAMLGLFGSLTGSVRSVADLAGKADVEVLGSTDAGIDGSVAAKVRATPGVRSAVALVRAPVVVNDHPVILVAADNDPKAPPIGGIGPSCVAGPPVSPRSIRAAPVVVGGKLASILGAKSGSIVTVFAGGHTTSAQVVGVLGCDKARVLNDGMFIATTLSLGDTFTGRGGRVDSIYVTAEHGRAAQVQSTLRAALGGQAIVASPELRVKLAEKGLKPLQQGLTTAISLAFVVAGFLVYNTMSMAALERRRELATLRAMGGRRRALLVGFLAEAGIMGLVGSLIGALAGVLVASRAISGTPTIVLDYLGVRPSFHLPASAVPLGVGVATLATLVAAFFPALTAVRVDPVDAMRPDGVLESDDGGHTRPLVVAIGLIAFFGGNALTVLGKGDIVLYGFGAITLGTVVASAGLTGRLAAVVGRLAGRFGSTGRLAAAGVERSPRRVWATTLAVTVAVGVVIALGGTVRNQSRSFRSDFSSLADTDLWVQATTPDTVPSQPTLPTEWATEISHVPGVAAVLRDQAAFMTLGDEQVIFEGMERGTNVPFYRLASERAERPLSGDGFIASKAWADRHHLRIGDPTTLPTPSGPQVVHIAAIVDVPVIVQGQLGIDYDRFTQWFGRKALSGLEVKLSPGADRAAVRDGIRDIVKGSPIPVNIYTGDEVLAGSMQSLKQSLAIFNAMIWVVVGATGLAILNTMAISVLERRRELGILRAVGTSRGTIRRMVMAEAAAITTAGCLIGFVLGLVQHRVAIEAMGGLVGFKVEYQFVVAPVITAAIAAVVMATVGSVGPAATAGRVDVIEAIGYE